MAKPLIILDFDGVLMDSVDFFEREFKRELVAIGKNFLRTRKDLLELFDDSIAVTLIEKGLTPEQMCTVWENLMHRAQSAEMKFCPGVPKMLAALDPLCDMAIVSSNAGATIRAQLERLGELSHFKRISGGDEDLRKADRIARCAAAMNGPKDRTYYVCDTAGDVREAHEVGIAAIVVSWGWHPIEHLEEAKPDAVVRTPGELVDFVRALADSVNADESTGH